MPDQSISTLSNFEQPAELTPEKGLEQPFPITEGSPGTKPQEAPLPGNVQNPEEVEHVVDKTDEEITTKKVVPGDSKTEFADENEKEFITQITSELPNAKP